MGTIIGLIVIAVVGFGFYVFLRFKSPSDAGRIADAVKTAALSIVTAVGVFWDVIQGLF